MNAVEQAKAALKVLTIEVLWKVRAEAIRSEKRRAQQWVEDELRERGENVSHG